MIGGIHPMMMTPVGGGGLKPQDVFAATLVTANGSSNQTVTTGVDLAGKGGMLWRKTREVSNQHVITTVGVNSYLQSNSTAAASAGDLVNYNATGFVDQQGFSSGVEQIAWSFAKAAKFFEQALVNHTNGTPTNIDLSILGAIGLAWAKRVDAAGDWIVWQRSLTAGNNLRLNTTSAQSTTNAWLSVSGTTLTISASAPSGSYKIDAFAHDTDASGIVQCGSTTMSGGVASVALGWRPQYIGLKAVNATSYWYVADTARGISSFGTAFLAPNVADAEFTSASRLSTSATGFTINSPLFVNGNEIAFWAIREPIF